MSLRQMATNAKAWYMARPGWLRHGVQYAGVAMLAYWVGTWGSSRYAPDRTQQVYELLSQKRPQIAHTAFQKGAAAAETLALDTITANPTTQGAGLKQKVADAIDPKKLADERYTEMTRQWKPFPD